MNEEILIPPEIEQQYEGRWIAWDIEAHIVLADGKTMDAVVDATTADRAAGKVIWYHNVLPRDAIMVGGIW